MQADLNWLVDDLIITETYQQGVNEATLDANRRYEQEYSTATKGAKMDGQAWCCPFSVNCLSLSLSFSCNGVEPNRVKKSTKPPEQPMPQQRVRKENGKMLP